MLAETNDASSKLYGVVPNKDPLALAMRESLITASSLRLQVSFLHHTYATALGVRASLDI